VPEIVLGFSLNMKPKKKTVVLVDLPKKQHAPQGALVSKQVRHRQVMNFTLSDEARAILKRLAIRFNEPASRVVERALFVIGEHLLDSKKKRLQAAADAVEAIKQMDQKIERGPKGKAKSLQPRRMVLEDI
jgi:hypothetical protein